MKIAFRLAGSLFLLAVFLKSSAQQPEKDAALLVVQAGVPRFLREGDHLEIAAIITNHSGKEKTGQISFQLSDATTSTPVDGWFQNIFPVQYFTVDAGKTETIPFPIDVPYLFKKPVRWRLTAQAETTSDHAEGILPIHSNKVLRTEIFSLNLPDSGTKYLEFKKLLQSDAATEHHSVTVSYFSNPIWQVVQALPYMAAIKEERAEQVWNRFYAYALATKIYNTSPAISTIIKSYNTLDTTTPQQHSQQNTELKQLLPEEMPWVFGAQNSLQEQKMIAAFFDSAALQNGLKSSLQKLKSLQTESGGFAWFNDGPDDSFITQYIVTGIGRLKKIAALTGETQEAVNGILKPALSYLDQMLATGYATFMKNKKTAQNQSITPLQVQYLYLRGFFADTVTNSLPAIRFYQQQAKQNWKAESVLLQAMTALALHRMGDKKTAAAILQSVKKTILTTKKALFDTSPHWWQNAVAQNALLIEAFTEITADTQLVETLQKNLFAANVFPATATADACYALLLPPANWQKNNAWIQLNLGNATVSNASGTSYFQVVITPPQLVPALGKITVFVRPSATSLPAETRAQAAVTWRYFQDADSLPNASAYFKITKKLLVKRSGNAAIITQSNTFQIGDTITVQLTVASDRELEYIHINDGYAAAFEPSDTSTRYQRKGNIAYYHTSKNVGIHFFVPVLQKGRSVFEYTLVVKHAGTFSNGITTVESLRAPAFGAYSEKARIQVE